MFVLNTAVLSPNLAATKVGGVFRLLKVLAPAEGTEQTIFLSTDGRRFITKIGTTPLPAILPGRISVERQ